ncbi:hypothetical protein SSOG_09013 [Streptomyces himastatinicus ATCC 53653]|uniref:Uncharacterized protein n=1 Tax=Streptomyces himastatinicus ATCC 53653 TaxID=457427 RepID=D9WL24_9ACTN|nr:hypothetical protein [Streptomyces himastatinicus]EFL29298.1 hypothetical protein SSOG_09013 [Streptomyces himastatinicus ATCC 53653]
MAGLRHMGGVMPLQYALRAAGAVVDRPGTAETDGSMPDEPSKAANQAGARG